MGKFTIQSTMNDAPPRLVVYGTGGIGKSTLAATAPGTVFIASEDGLRNIDAQAVKPYPNTWEDVLEAVDELAAAPDVKGIAIDSLDWLEPLCWAFVCKLGKKSDIEAFGYGKGYTAALDQWRVLLHKLRAAHEAGKRIILIAHGVRKNYKNPAGEDFEHWTIKLHEKAAGLIVEWADVVGFAEAEVATFETSKGSDRYKGIATGKRVLRVQPSAAFLAKTRYAMPKTLPLNWQDFDDAVKAGGPAAVSRMKLELEAKIAELGDDMVGAGARTFLRTRGESVATLTEAIGTVDAYLAERRKAG